MDGMCAPGKPGRFRMLCLPALLLLVSLASATPLINFTAPTPQNGTALNQSAVTINASVSENVTQCLLFLRDLQNPNKLWTNVRHLNVSGGVFDYNASIGPNNQVSFTMMHMIPMDAGETNTCYLLNSGNSVCFGYNFYGESTNHTGGNAIQVSAGEEHTCYLLSNGNSTCYGNNADGRATNYTGGNAVALSAGDVNTCYLLSNGNSLCYGDNSYGQRVNYSGGDAIAVACGSGHVCYLLSNGNSICHGSNNLGQAYNHTGGNAVAISAGNAFTCYVLSSGNSVCYGSGSYGQERVHTGANALSVSTSFRHTCYLLNNGNSICYGYNGWGESTNHTGGNAIAVSVGDQHSCYLLSNGSSLCYGDNAYGTGQATNYSGANITIPFRTSMPMEIHNNDSGTWASLATSLLEDAGYACWVSCNATAGGSNSTANRTFTLERSVVISNVTNITLPGEASATIAWATNKNANSTITYGSTLALGTHATNSTNSAVHSILLTGLSQHALYYYNLTSCTAAGLCNTSGPFSFITDITPPLVLLASPTPANGSTLGAQTIAINATASENVTQCLLFLRDLQNPGKLWTNLRHLNTYGGAFDYNASYGAGNYSSFTLNNRIILAAGASRTCYLLSNGNSVCYGDHTGSISDSYGGGDAVSVAPGTSHTCYLLSNGNSVCYGNNTYGQAYNYTGGNAIALSAGAYFTCYLLSNGNSSCYGNSSYGETTSHAGGDAIAIDAGNYYSCYLLSNGNSRCYGTNANGQSYNYTGGNAISVSAGASHSCYLLSNGNSACYGTNTDGRATNHTGGNAVAVTAAFNNACYLLSNGNSRCYGSNVNSKSTNYTGGDAIAISAAVGQTCYLLSNSNSACYGSNTNGQAINYTGGNIRIPFATAYSMQASNSDSGTTASYVLPALPSGNYSIYANCTDLAGNSNVTETRNITVDSAIPVITLSSPSNLSVSNSSGVTFNFTAVGAATMNCSLFIDNALNTTNSSTQNNTLSTIAVSGIAEGSHAWYVRCNDTSGKAGTSETRNFTVDTAAPVVALVSPADGFSLTTSTMTFSFTVADNQSALLNCSIYLDGTAAGNNPSAANNTQTFFLVTNIQFGQHTWNVNCSDAAGNPGSGEGRTFSRFSEPSSPSRPPSSQPTPLVPECHEDRNCTDNATCSNGSCVAVPCSCGAVLNHQCVAYSCCLDSECPQGEKCSGHVCIAPPPTTPPLPPQPPGPSPANQTPPQPVTGCNTSNQCTPEQFCGKGVCSNVTGMCGYAANHAWISHACGPEAGCPVCAQGKVCISRKCTPLATSSPPTGAAPAGSPKPLPALIYDAVAGVLPWLSALLVAAGVGIYIMFGRRRK